MIVKPSVSNLTAASDPQLNLDVTTVTTSMEGNLNYPTPLPTIPILTAANAEFAQAIADAAGGGKEATSAKNAKRAIVVSLMRQLASYVAVACQDDMTKLLSSGFPVQKPNRTPAVVPPTPASPTCTQLLTGQVMASSGPCFGTYIYNSRVALASAPTTYVQHQQSTGSKATYNGLTPGQLYLFEFNAVGTAGTSDWSDAGSIMVI